MNPLAKEVCGSCPHHGALHVLPVGACQVNGCRCTAFRDPNKPEQSEGDDDRTLVVRIPVGYAATVHVFPVGEDGS